MAIEDRKGHEARRGDDASRLAHARSKNIDLYCSSKFRKERIENNSATSAFFRLSPCCTFQSLMSQERNGD
jgi:hypothetical protein